MGSEKEPPILVVHQPHNMAHVRLITINRPALRNALNAEVAHMLCDAIRDADQDPSVRVVVLTGAGETAFCAGADLSGIFADVGSALEGGTSAFATLFSAMRHGGVPIVAAVNGVAVGGGFGLVLAADLVVMSSLARVGTPEVRRGLFAMFISRFMYEVMPEKIANEILFLGETLSADEAKLLHIANRVVLPEEVLPTAFELARRIAEHSGSVLRKGKRAIRKQKDMTFPEANAFLGKQLAENLTLADASEGIKAFFEKRKPVWKDY